MGSLQIANMVLKIVFKTKSKAEIQRLKIQSIDSEIRTWVFLNL